MNSNPTYSHNKVLTTDEINSSALVDLMIKRGVSEIELVLTCGGYELYRFADGDEVISTNAGIVTDYEDEFWELKPEIFGND